MYYLLRNMMLGKFLRSKLEKDERAFVADNIDKHRKVFWLNNIAIVLAILGIRDMPMENLKVLMPGLLTPTLGLFGAWFIISFGGVPAKLMAVAMDVTFWMFTGFMMSFSTMFIILMYVSPPALFLVYVIIYVGVIYACVQYDTCDGLKAGLDEAQLKHSRAALLYYHREGIDPDNPGVDKPKE